jgi:hypothetical protein
MAAGLFDRTKESPQAITCREKWHWSCLRRRIQRHQEGTRRHHHGAAAPAGSIRHREQSDVDAEVAGSAARANQA